MKPHAFVAMPFGTKPGPDGTPIDFNRVHDELLRPALEAAGCEVFRADEEQRAGDIRSDMFQELLVADLVLADLTLDNPNVWYELGVRHALRARGVVIVQGPRPTSPFDIYTDRKLHYRLKDGAPNPQTLDEDRAALTAMARATLDASSRRKVSPVHALLPHLQEPEWRSLLMGRDNEFGEAHERWQIRMDVARKRNRAGDLLVLADEAPARALWIEAKRAAGQSLQELRQYAFALEQYEMIGLKSLNGPWPKAVYYQPSELLGTIYVWPNPAQGEMHLFAYTQFQAYANLTDSIQFPPGYVNAMRFCLAERLMPMYGKTNQIMMAKIEALAAQGKATIKRTNMRPPQVSRYPDQLLWGKSKDAGWIMDGGFC